MVAKQNSDLIFFSALCGDISSDFLAHHSWAIHGASSNGPHHISHNLVSLLQTKQEQSMEWQRALLGSRVAHREQLLQQEGKQGVAHPWGACGGNHKEDNEWYSPNSSLS
nr:hypothetical protein Iba_scaffold51145CG0010 [Ipomoea batatas]